MPRRLVHLIIAATLLRMLVAAILEFGNDEVYYYLYALDLQPNYFDHPPGVAWLIRIFTFNLLFTDEFFVRLGAIACSAVGTALVYRLGTVLKNEQTGWYAAILYTGNIYTSLIAGTFIIPDSPQVVFWLASALTMHDILVTPAEEAVPRKKWLLFGLFSGLTILCKVHGIFLWGSLGLYMLLYERSLLRHLDLYLAAAVTAMVISPIFIWNFQNDFITYRFHSGRVGIEETWIHLDYFIQAVAGQMAYSNPVNAVLIILAAWRLRTMKFLSESSLRFVLVNGLPLVAVVTVMSLSSSMLPHWSGPGVMMLSFLAAAYLDEKKLIAGMTHDPRVLKASTVTVGVLALLTMLFIQFYPGTFGSHQKNEFGENDFTLDLNGWASFSADFRGWLAEEERKGTVPKDLPLVVNKWFPGAHIDYYVARPLNRHVVGVGWVRDVHQYAWLNSERPPLKAGDAALCIVPSNYHQVLHDTYYNQFESIELRKVFYQYRSGKMSRYFIVYLMKGYKGDDEAHQPPFRPVD